MEAYDKIGNSYNNTRKADIRITTILMRLMHCLPNATIADIGAGTGNYSYELAKNNFSVMAVEPSEIMIRQAKQHPDLHWVKGSAESIPLESSSVDAVICTLATHHFASIASFVSESKRILKPNGNLVIFTFDPDLLTEKDWLKDYFIDLHPNAMNSVPRQGAMLDMLESEFHNQPTISNFPLPPDLTDCFFRSGWKYPERYLDPNFRNGISIFRLADSNIVSNAINRLQNDLQMGIWDKRYGYTRNQDYFDADYYFIAVTKTDNG